MALACGALLVAGCGDSESSAEGQQAGPSAAFVEIVRELKQAALSESSYRAVRRAKKSKELNVPETSVIDAFCETVWQLDVNGETDRLTRYAYVVDRIKGLAGYDLPSKYSTQIRKALDELIGIIPLRSFDEAENRLYKRACYT